MGGGHMWRWRDIGCGRDERRERARFVTDAQQAALFQAFDARGESAVTGCEFQSIGDAA